jgi:signal transduction histidine kinase
MKVCYKTYDALRILLDLSRVVSSSPDLDKVSGLVLKELTKALRADHAALFLMDEKTPRLSLSKAEGFGSDETGNIALLGSWEIINDYLIKEKKGITVNNIEASPLFSKKTLPFSHSKIPVKSFLASPLEKDSRMTGTLIVSNGRRSDCLFSEEDEKVLTTLSNYIAIAISGTRLFEELSKTQAEASQMEKMADIGILASGINHEISNPLGIARSRCEAFLLNLRDGLYKDISPESLLDKSKDIMGNVIKEIDRATGISQRLSSFAKPSKDKPEIVNIEKEADEVLGLLSYELRLKAIEVKKEIEKGLSGILVDKKQFQEVLFNLLRNAIHAIGASKGTIVIASAAKENRVIINIRDTGEGIAEENIKELFKPFFTTKGPGKGTGYGLFVVRKIVEKNGGRIYLKETKVGKGTTFTLEFPIAR